MGSTVDTISQPSQLKGFGLGSARHYQLSSGDCVDDGIEGTISKALGAPDLRDSAVSLDLSKGTEDQEAMGTNEGQENDPGDSQPSAFDQASADEAVPGDDTQAAVPPTLSSPLSSPPQSPLVSPSDAPTASLVPPIPVPRQEDSERVTYTWMKDISERVGRLENTLPAVERDSASTTGGSDSDSDDEDETNGLESQTEKLVGDLVWTRTEPEVRDCNWKQFKNRYPNEKGDHVEYAIETLRASDDLLDDMEDEQLSRIPESRRKDYQKKEAKPEGASGGATARKTSQQRHDLERIRINSSIVLGYIAKVSGQRAWSARPHTFLKPFRLFIDLHDRMEAELSKLAKKYGGGAPGDQPGDQTQSLQQAAAGGGADEEVVRLKGVAEDQGSANGADQRDHTAATDAQGPADSSKEAAVCPMLQNKELIEAMNSEKAYKDMKCYVELVRAKVFPWYNKFQTADADNLAKLEYEDLWALFRLGDLVYRSESTLGKNPSDTFRIGTSHANSTDMMHRVWRVCFVGTSSNARWEVDDLEQFSATGRLKRQADEKEKATPELCQIGLYYIDYDGFEYSGVREYIDIPGFSGKKDITSLPFYPIRFFRDHESTLARLRARGEKFRRLISESSRGGQVRPVAHDGWTRTRNPAGEPIVEQGRVPAQPQYIDSDVIIDFEETFRTNPWWRPCFGRASTWHVEPELVTDDFAIHYWLSKPDKFDKVDKVDKPDKPDSAKEPQKTTQRKLKEIVVDRDCANISQESRLFGTDKFLSEKRGAANNEADSAAVLAPQEFSRDDLALLPPRVFAYALRQRRFINADLKYLKEIAMPNEDEDPFDQLQIARGHKTMIQSIVFEHFQKKEIRQQRQTSDSGAADLVLNQDFIRNKGTGLVILLHGEPGVGKTATAEAVSAIRGKPLFAITCGELGTTPEELENRLNEIFRLANLWDCILLLDEAEIFLSQRESTDTSLQRNAMVAVFLRTLEYYQGILFLTTNRIGAMDEAVKSRVHVALEYPALDWKATKALFKQNLKRLKKIEAERGQVAVVRDKEIMKWAKEDWDSREEGHRWNGRQIRNAFQIASSLAHYCQSRKAKVKGEEPYIGREHFVEVAEATDNFTAFLKSLFGKQDDERAFELGDRPPRAGKREGTQGATGAASSGGPPQGINRFTLKSRSTHNQQDDTSRNRSPDRPSGSRHASTSQLPPPQPPARTTASTAWQPDHRDQRYSNSNVGSVKEQQQQQQQQNARTRDKEKGRDSKDERGKEKRRKGDDKEKKGKKHKKSSKKSKQSSSDDSSSDSSDSDSSSGGGGKKASKKALHKGLLTSSSSSSSSSSDDDSD